MMNNYYKSRSIALLFLTAILTLWVGKSEAQSYVKEYDNPIIQFLNLPELLPAHVGFCLMDVKTKTVVAQLNSTKRFLPASNLKVLSTFAGLEVLGYNFKFDTKLGTDGYMLGDVIKGNLIIRGTGDPTLGSEFFEHGVKYDALFSAWADTLYKRGIRVIDGRVIGDGSFFEGRAVSGGWPYNDIGNYYGSGAYGLNINQNVCSLVYKLGTNNMPTQFYKSEPLVPGIEVINSITSSTLVSNDKAIIYSAPNAYVLYSEGLLPSGKGNFVVKATYPDPAHQTAYMFTTALRNKGIKVMREPESDVTLKALREPIPVIKRTFLTHYSASLYKIAFETNQNSINIFAEAIMRRMAYQTLSATSYEKSLESLTAFYTTNGVDANGQKIYDACGLALNNGISPAFMASALTFINNSANANKFLETLPVSGQSGTLKSFGSTWPLNGKLRAKTGNLTGVMCFSGYLTNTSGKNLAVVLFINGYDGFAYKVRPKVEEFLVKIAKVKY